MSSNKKSIVLLLLLFAIVAVGSWYYFSGKAKTDSPQQALSTESEQQENQDEHAGHDHGHGGHEEEASAPKSFDQICEKSTPHDLVDKPILGKRGVGDPNAPVKIQEFFSLTCNHCALFHAGTFQDIKSKYIDTGKVYFQFEEFPLNGPALYGSMIARCLPKERYAGFIDLLLKTQEKWAFGGDFKGALMQNAKLAGMSEEEFNTCFGNKQLQQEIAANIKEASEAWNISSTPSFAVNNGECLIRGGKSTEDFGVVIDQLLNQASENQE